MREAEKPLHIYPWTLLKFRLDVIIFMGNLTLRLENFQTATYSFVYFFGVFFIMKDAKKCLFVRYSDFKK